MAREAETTEEEEVSPAAPPSQELETALAELRAVSEAYLEACSALGEAVVAQRLLSKAVRSLQQAPPPEGD